MTPWLLIPVKSLYTGKSRLRPVLADEARRALNEFFLRRMLTAAQRFPGRKRTAVISDCEVVLRIANACGVQSIPQTSGCGLNGAAREGIVKLRRLGARDIVLIACDAPMVGANDLRGLADSRVNQGRIVICPDKHRTGTNAILIPAGAQMEFRFGKGSLSRHYVEALRAGFLPRVHVNPRIAFDVDTPQDFASWVRAAGQRPSAVAALRVSAAQE